MDWYRQQAVGGVFRAVNESLRLFQDPGALQRMQFIVLPSDVDKVAKNAVELEDEDDWARWAFALCLHLSRCRLQHLLWHVQGPGALAALLSEDETERTLCIKFLLDVGASLEAASSCSWPAVAHMLQRHWARRPYMVAVREGLGSSSSTTVAVDVLDQVKNLFVCPSTKIIEDGFQRIRVQQLRGQSSSIVGPMRAYHTVMQQGVLNKLHHFPEVQSEDCSEAQRLQLPRTVAKQCFQLFGKKSTLPLSSCETKSKKASCH
eukprot:1081120-Amphidinium_carterae.1